MAALPNSQLLAIGGGWRGMGGDPAPRICSEARKPVPLEPISPVRNALRPRRLAGAAALRSRQLQGLCRGERRPGSHNIARPGAGSYSFTRGGSAPARATNPGPVRSPRPAPQPEARATPTRGQGAPRRAPGSRTVPPKPLPLPRHTHHQPSHPRIQNPFFVPGRRRETGALWVGNRSRPALFWGALLPGAPPYLQLLRAAAAQGCWRTGPSSPERRQEPEEMPCVCGV